VKERRVFLGGAAFPIALLSLLRIGFTTTGHVYSRSLAKVCDNENDHEKMRVAPQLRDVGVEALAGQP